MANAMTEARQMQMEGLMPVERSVTIHLNGTEIVTIQSSLSHLDELAVGFLVAEGLLNKSDRITKLSVDERTGMVWVDVEGSKDIAAKMMGKRFVTSGCGKGFSFSNPGDLGGLKKIESSFVISKRAVSELMKELLVEGRQPGTHSSAIADKNGIEVIRHDIGRHNTVDMLIGHLFLSGTVGGLIMLTTGRISYEMAVKAAKVEIPVIASRSAATDLAVRLSKKMGVEVIGYVRGKDIVVYTNHGRVID